MALPIGSFKDPNAIEPHLGHWLTYEEFKVVWTYQWVAWFFGRLGFESLSEDERAIFNDLTTAMDWAIRELHGRGMTFRGINVAANGVLELSRGGPIELRNELFLDRIRRGKMLDPVVNLEFTIAELTLRNVRFDRKTLEEARASCVDDLANWRAQFEPEERQLATEAIEGLARVAGLQKRNELKGR